MAKKSSAPAAVPVAALVKARKSKAEASALSPTRLFVGRVAGDRIVLQAQPQSHRRPDRAGNPGRAHCEKTGVNGYDQNCGF